MDAKDLLGLGQLADSKLINNVYEDGLSGAVTQSGRTLEDICKASRWLTAPIMFAAAWLDRLERYCKRISEGVPTERQVAPDPAIAVPLLTNLRNIEEDSLLADMYVSLLRKAIDRDFQKSLHPAFVMIMSQIAPEEVLILQHLRNNEMQLQTLHKADAKHTFISFIGSSFDCSDFSYNAHFYTQHLNQLGLVNWVNVGGMKQVGANIEETSHVNITSFGVEFLNASTSN